MRRTLAILLRHQLFVSKFVSLSVLSNSTFYIAFYLVLFNTAVTGEMCEVQVRVQDEVGFYL